MPDRIDTANIPGQTGRSGSIDDNSLRDMRLRRAARDFEALFLYELLKTMRASFASSATGESGFGKEVFMSIADQALADGLSKSGDLGIAQMLIKSLDGRDESNVGEVDESGSGTDRFSPLDLGSPSYLRLKRSGTMSFDATRKTGLRRAANVSGLDNFIELSAKKYGLSADLIRAVIHVESAGDSSAVSSKGAKGLMQLTDSTAQDLGVTDVFDPKENIDAGSRYLSRLLKRFSGDLKLALAAYNAGPSAVERHRGLPPYSETIRYVDRVLGFMQNDF